VSQRRIPGGSITSFLTHRRVRQAALGAFAERGYRSTSLKVVAEMLGVTRQALYHHYASKGEILGDLFDEMMTKLEESTAEVERGAAEDGAAFADLVRSHVRIATANWQLLSVLIRERPELARLPSAPDQRIRRSRYVESFTVAYERGTSTGELLRADSRVIVNFVLSAVNVISMWFRGSRAHASPPSIAEEIFDLLAGGFLVDGGEHGVAGRSNSRPVNAPPPLSGDARYDRPPLSADPSGIGQLLEAPLTRGSVDKADAQSVRRSE
jgi:TetR/AcrR family transcriptional regulator, cholesterol catabolism regulator